MPVADCIREIVSTAAPAVTTVILSLIRRPLPGAAGYRLADLLRAPFWTYLEGQLALWPALRVLVLKVTWTPREGQDDSREEDAVLKALQKLLPLLHSQDKVKITLTRRQ